MTATTTSNLPPPPKKKKKRRGGGGGKSWFFPTGSLRYEISKFLAVVNNVGQIRKKMYKWRDLLLVRLKFYRSIFNYLELIFWKYVIYKAINIWCVMGVICKFTFWHVDPKPLLNLSTASLRYSFCNIEKVQAASLLFTSLQKMRTWSYSGS